MTTIVRSQDLELRPGGTVRFEGAPHGSLASFFHVKNAPGKGALLHRHPYPETWLVRAGTVRFTVGGEPVEATAGDIVIAPANVPHMFVATGSEMLEMVCIHPSAVILQEYLPEDVA